MARVSMEKKLNDFEDKDKHEAHSNCGGGRSCIAWRPGLWLKQAFNVGLPCTCATVAFPPTKRGQVLSSPHCFRLSKNCFRFYATGWPRKGDRHEKMRELKALVRLKWQEPCEHFSTSSIQEMGLLDENGKKKPTPGRSSNNPKAQATLGLRL